MYTIQRTSNCTRLIVLLIYFLWLICLFRIGLQGAGSSIQGAGSSMQGAGSIRNNFLAGLTGGEHEAQVISELGFYKYIDIVELGMDSWTRYR